MLFLPENWLTSSEAFKDDKYYWPIKLLKQLDRFPHEYNTWLGYGHTINIYCVIPLYKEERDYKLENGVDALFEKLTEVEGQGYLIQPSRKNACK